MRFKSLIESFIYQIECIRVYMCVYVWVCDQIWIDSEFIVCYTFFTLCFMRIVCVFIQVFTFFGIINTIHRLNFFISLFIRCHWIDGDLNILRMRVYRRWFIGFNRFRRNRRCVTRCRFFIMCIECYCIAIWFAKYRVFSVCMFIFTWGIWAC